MKCVWTNVSFGTLTCLLVTCHVISDDMCHVIFCPPLQANDLCVTLLPFPQELNQWLIWRNHSLIIMILCKNVSQKMQLARHKWEQNTAEIPPSPQKKRNDAERIEPSPIFPAADLLTRRLHTWSRCCCAFSHPGPGWGRSPWCKGVCHFSQACGIHCTAPAKAEKVIWTNILLPFKAEMQNIYIVGNSSSSPRF